MRKRLARTGLMSIAALASAPASACLARLEVPFAPAQVSVPAGNRIPEFVAAAGTKPAIILVAVHGPDESLSRRRAAGLIHLLQMSGVAPDGIRARVQKTARAGASLTILAADAGRNRNGPAIDKSIPPPSLCG